MKVVTGWGEKWARRAWEKERRRIWRIIDKEARRSEAEQESGVVEGQGAGRQRGILWPRTG